jgi:hypothetical protein
MFHVLLLVVCLSGMTVGHSNFLDLLKKARVAAKEYYGNYWDSSSSSPYDSTMNSWSTSSPSPYDHSCHKAIGLRNPSYSSYLCYKATGLRNPNYSSHSCHKAIGLMHPSYSNYSSYHKGSALGRTRYSNNSSCRKMIGLRNPSYSSNSCHTVMVRRYSMRIPQTSRLIT